jgi:hypothetical protein
METSVPEQIESDALKANLRETAQQVVIKRNINCFLKLSPGIGASTTILKNSFLSFVTPSVTGH